MTFHVGQKVCCIEDDGGMMNLPPITKGTICVVNFVGTTFYPDDDGSFYPTLMFDGYKPVPLEDGLAVFYSGLRFRPLVEKKTSIAIFERMLLPQKVDA